MPVIWINIKDIPAEGREFSFSDQEIWTEPCEEFKVPCRFVKPFDANVMLLPQKEGILVRGDMNGEVAVPCDRCAEEALVKVELHFDEFEVYPPRHEPHGGRRKRRPEPAGQDNDDDNADDCSDLIREGKNGFELDVATMLWEQFLLALPVKPLCKPDCKGLCEGCGKDLNKEPCECQKDVGDPRLAKLRSLKVS